MSTMHSEVREYHLLNRTFYDGVVPENYLLQVIGGLRFLCTPGYKAPMVVLRSLNVFRYRKRALSLRQLYEVAPYLNKGSYDVIHCHFGPNGIRGAKLRSIGALKGKLITTFHGYDVTTYVSGTGQDVYRELFKDADLFTYNSEATREKLMRMDCPRDKLMKLPMGADLKRIGFSERKLNADASIRILSVGRLVEMKGREYAIRAVAKVAKKFPNIRYTIVGDGTFKRRLATLVEELGAGYAISLTGWVSSSKLRHLYETSHIFLHPSVRSTDGKSAFLVPERDVDTLAERLAYLIEHPEVWPKMGRAGRKHVEANYDIGKLNDRLVEIYEKLLDST